MTIRRVGEGAYFVPSYSVSTLVVFQEGFTNQGIALPEEIGWITGDPQILEGQPFADKPFEEISQAQNGLK